MDGTANFISSLHPPTEIYVLDYNNTDSINHDSTFGGSIIFIPDSPLSTAPNTPEQSPKRSMTPPPPPLTADPANTVLAAAYSKTRQHDNQNNLVGEMDGRESRKSRLKAARAARRPGGDNHALLFEEKKTGDELIDCFSNHTMDDELRMPRRIQSIYLSPRVAARSYSTNLVDRAGLSSDNDDNEEDDLGPKMMMGMDQPSIEEIIMGSRLSVTSNGVEVNRQPSNFALVAASPQAAADYFPSFDEEDERSTRLSNNSQAPSIDEKAMKSSLSVKNVKVLGSFESPLSPTSHGPVTTTEALSAAGRRAALEKESRLDRLTRGRSPEREWTSRRQGPKSDTPSIEALQDTIPPIPKRRSSSLSPSRLTSRLTLSIEQTPEPSIIKRFVSKSPPASRTRRSPKDQSNQRQAPSTSTSIIDNKSSKSPPPSRSPKEPSHQRSAPSTVKSEPSIMVESRGSKSPPASRIRRSSKELRNAPSATIERTPEPSTIESRGSKSPPANRTMRFPNEQTNHRNTTSTTIDRISKRQVKKPAETRETEKAKPEPANQSIPRHSTTINQQQEDRGLLRAWRNEEIMGADTDHPRTNRYKPSYQKASSSTDSYRKERFPERRGSTRPIDWTSYIPSERDTAGERPTGHDDVSTSDETPLVRNIISSPYREHQQQQSLRETEKQKQLRSMYGQARKQKNNPAAESLETKLPNLMVDHTLLRDIGVKALISVCDGIGSLFLTDTKQITVKSVKANYSKLASPSSSTTTTNASKQTQQRKKASRSERSVSSKREYKDEIFQPWAVEKKDEAEQSDQAPPNSTLPSQAILSPGIPKEAGRDTAHASINVTVLGTEQPFPSYTSKSIVVEDADSDGEFDIPPPPPPIEEVAEVETSPSLPVEEATEHDNNSLVDSDSDTCTETDASLISATDAPESSVVDEGNNHNLMDNEEEASLSTIASPSHSTSTSLSPESHEIGPIVKTHVNLEKEYDGSNSGEANAMLNSDSQLSPAEPVVPTEEPDASRCNKRQDLYRANTSDDTSVSASSRATIQDQLSDVWSLASAIKIQANRESPSCQSLDEHKRSDPDGNKDSPFADNSKDTTNTACLTPTEKESSYEISEPPTLRRLNGSTDSIVPEFSTYDSAEARDQRWTDDVSSASTIPSDEKPKSPVATLSPMSEFLAERVRDGRCMMKSPPEGLANDELVESVCGSDMKCPTLSSESHKSVEGEKVVSSISASCDDLSTVRNSDTFANNVNDVLEYNAPGGSNDTAKKSVEQSLEKLDRVLSRYPSDTTSDLLSRLDEMVYDLDCIAAGLPCDSSDAQSTATVPSFAEALEVDIEPCTQDDSDDMNIRRDSSPPSEGFEGLPHLVCSINSDPGIAKGDIMISLLNNDSCRIKDAVWRCRLMRQYSDVDWLEKKANKRQPSKRQPSFSILPNVDEDREAGGIHDVVQLELAALNCLKYDDFGGAFELCSDIYHKYIEYEVEIQHNTDLLEKFKLYKATASYNLGIVHLLRGDIEEALTCHETAVQLRNGCRDIRDSEYATLLNKCAACRFAAGDFISAFSEMEEALLLAREELLSLDDYRQLAEILNNLGCMSYIGGKIDRAELYFDESLSLHAKVTNKSLYLGSRFSGHSAILNASITKANLGFLFLVTQKPTMSLGMLESALRDQEILLFGPHVTIISTMDHLIVANLLSGKKKSASQLLRRVYHILAEAFGHDSEQCLTTKRKIIALEMKDGSADRSTTTSGLDASKKKAVRYGKKSRARGSAVLSSTKSKSLNPL